MSAYSTKDAGVVSVTKQLREASAIVDSKRRIEATVEIWKGIPVMVGGDKERAVAIKKSMIEGGMLDDPQVLSIVQRHEESPGMRMLITERLNFFRGDEYAGITLHGKQRDMDIKARQLETISNIYDIDTLNKLHHGEKDPELRLAISEQINMVNNDEYHGGAKAQAKSMIRKVSTIVETREYPDSEEMKGLFDSKTE